LGGADTPEAHLYAPISPNGLGVSGETERFKKIGVNYDNV